MAVSSAFLGKVKLALRISSTSFDSQISDLIEEAKLDLSKTANISAAAVAAPDALVKGAIKCYCGSMWSDDPDEADRLKKCYDDYKAKLSMSSAYGDYEEAGT